MESNGPFPCFLVTNFYSINYNTSPRLAQCYEGGFLRREFLGVPVGVLSDFKMGYANFAADS